MPYRFLFEFFNFSILLTKSRFSCDFSSKNFSKLFIFLSFSIIQSQQSLRSCSYSNLTCSMYFLCSMSEFDLVDSMAIQIEFFRSCSCYSLRCLRSLCADSLIAFSLSSFLASRSQKFLLHSVKYKLISESCELFKFLTFFSSSKFNFIWCLLYSSNYRETFLSSKIMQCTFSLYCVPKPRANSSCSFFRLDIKILSFWDCSRSPLIL